MNKEQKNKLIHEFLGYEWSKSKILKQDYSSEFPPTIWGAVEKIIRYEFDEGDNAYFSTFGMIAKDTGNFMVRINRFGLHEGETLLKALFEAVVEFIEWYNAVENG